MFMGSCFPCLAHKRPKRQKGRSGGSTVPSDQKDEPAKGAIRVKTVKKGRSGGSTVPSDQKDEPAKGATRVKMVMTTEEADRLLSKLAGSKESAVEYGVTSELRRSRGQRWSSDAFGSRPDSWKPVLESIPE